MPLWRTIKSRYKKLWIIILQINSRPLWVKSAIKVSIADHLDKFGKIKEIFLVATSIMFLQKCFIWCNEHCQDSPCFDPTQQVFPVTSSVTTHSNVYFGEVFLPCSCGPDGAPNYSTLPADPEIAFQLSQKAEKWLVMKLSIYPQAGQSYCWITVDIVIEAGGSMWSKPREGQLKSSESISELEMVK